MLYGLYISFVCESGIFALKNVDHRKNNEMRGYTLKFNVGRQQQQKNISGLGEHWTASQHTQI